MAATNFYRSVAISVLVNALLIIPILHAQPPVFSNAVTMPAGEPAGRLAIPVRFSTPLYLEQPS